MLCSITFVKGESSKNDVTHFRLDIVFVEITRMTAIAIYSISQEKFLKCYSLSNLNNTVLISKMFGRSIERNREVVNSTGIDNFTLLPAVWLYRRRLLCWNISVTNW